MEIGPDLRIGALLHLWRWDAIMVYERMMNARGRMSCLIFRNTGKN